MYGAAQKEREKERSKLKSNKNNVELALVKRQRTRSDAWTAVNAARHAPVTARRIMPYHTHARINKPRGARPNRRISQLVRAIRMASRLSSFSPARNRKRKAESSELGCEQRDRWDQKWYGKTASVGPWPSRSQCCHSSTFVAAFKLYLTSQIDICRESFSRMSEIPVSSVTGQLLKTSNTWEAQQQKLLIWPPRPMPRQSHQLNFLRKRKIDLKNGGVTFAAGCSCRVQTSASEK